MNFVEKKYLNIKTKIECSEIPRTGRLASIAFDSKLKSMQSTGFSILMRTIALHK